MKEVVAIVRMNMMNKTKRALADAGLGSITARDALGRGKGIVDLNLLVASAQNYGAMNLDIRNVAKALIKDGQVSNGILNMVEMGFRSYDPCFSCATHAAIGQMPMVVTLEGPDGTVLCERRRDG